MYRKQKIHSKKKQELPKHGKTYGYPPSMRHGSTTHTHMAYDFSLPPQYWMQWPRQRTNRNLNCVEVEGFYPESNSFPWSLRSAAQSSDRQFFSNQVWRGNSKVHSSYDLMLSMPSKHRPIFRLGGSVVLLLELRTESTFWSRKARFFTLSLLSFNQSNDGLWFKAKSWKET